MQLQPSSLTSGQIAFRPRALSSPPFLVRGFFYLFVVSIPFEMIPLSLGQGYLSIAKLTGYLLILVCLMYPKVCFRKPPEEFWFFSVYLVFFVLIAVLFSTAYIDRAVVRLIQQAQLLVLFWISYSLLVFPPVAVTTIRALVASSLLLVPLQLAGFTVGRQGITGRQSALAWDPNTLAALLVVAFILTFGLSFGRSSRMKGRHGWAALVLVVLTIGIVASGSRTATVALLMGMSPYLLVWARGRKKARRLFATILAVVLVLVFLSRSDVQRDRWRTTFQEGSLARREQIYPACLRMIAERPVAGFGPVRHLHILGERVGGAYVDTHNLFLWVLTEVGLLGGLPFLWAFLILYRKAWTASRGPYGWLPMAVFLALVTINMGLTWHNRKLFWLMLAFTSASVVAGRTRAGFLAAGMTRRRAALVPVASRSRTR